MHSLCWLKPELNRAETEAFWNRQYQNYETADMTNDNYSEIAQVTDLINGHLFEELVCLGGAVGCRDPKLILQQNYCFGKGGGCSPGKSLPRVFFNDLAPFQVEWAQRKILKPCMDCGVVIDFHAGPIVEVCDLVGAGERILLLGLYSIEGFFESDKADAYPMCGFEEYLKNSDVIGDQFWFDWLVFDHSREVLEISPTGLCISAESMPEERLELKRKLWENYATMSESVGNVIEQRSLIALQIVAKHINKEGCFISHWYNVEELSALLSRTFPHKEFEERHFRFPKGVLYQIKRVETNPRGVVTLLNNVLGNILPEEQFPTLKKIKTIL